VSKIGKKENFLMLVLSILGILCFPLNPLVITGLLKTEFILSLAIMGWIFWAIGMVLVMAPIIMFPRHGGVPKGKTFVHTTQIVKTGIYAIVRHPQYLGGILSLFIATPLFYPHWLFVILGVPGIIIIYWGTKEEDKRLINQFGDDYREYRQEVPGINLILGIIRVLRHKNEAGVI
jgi:protein-S-isoprenylcysteine O-methyltransferase Ste14